MEPTDALFDAINRGDIGAAREAMSRGADLQGQKHPRHDAAGVSIDLGRNDISFLLLSMRAADDGRSRQAPAAPDDGETARDEAGKQAPPPRHRSSHQRQPPSQTARLYGGEGNAEPEAGFLGFDSAGGDGGNSSS